MLPLVYLACLDTSGLQFVFIFQTLSLFQRSDGLRKLLQAIRSTEDSLKPIFISIGHRVSLDTAITIIKMTCKYRVPEPVRQVRSGASSNLWIYIHVRDPSS